MSRHVNGKSRDKSPSLVVTPLLDFHGSRVRFDKGRKSLWKKADYLWHAAEGDPLSPTSTVRRCPLSDEGIQQAFQLVLRKACGMPAEFAKRYTKHSARKLMVTRGKWPLSSGVGRAPPLTNRYSRQQRMPGASVRLRS